MRRIDIEKAVAFVELLYKRRGVVTLLLLALSTATCIIFFGIQAGDSERYLRLANNISQGHGFSNGTSAPYFPEVFNMPLYPYFVAFWTKLGVGIYGIAVIQVILYFLAVLLVGKTAMVLTRDRMVALLATLIPVAYLPIVRWMVTIQTEFPSAFLFSSVCLCFLYFLTAPTWKNTSALGLFLAGMFLTRPAYFALFPIAAITGALHHYRAGRLKYSIMLIAMLSLTTLSWGWRNVMVLSGAFQPFGVGSGMGLFQAAVEIQEPNIEKRDALIYKLPDHQMVVWGNDPLQRLESDRRLKQAAMDTIRVRWWDYAKRTVYLSVWRQWIEAFDQGLPRALVVIVAAMSVGLLILAYIGVFATARNNLTALSLASLCFAVCASHALFIQTARYTAPVRPILYIFSSMAIVSLIRKTRKWFERYGWIETGRRFE